MSLTTIRQQTQIDLNVELEFRDVLLAGYAIFAHRARVPILLYAFFLTIALTLLLFQGSQTGGRPGPLWLLALLAILFPAVPLGFIYWNTKTQFRRAADRELHYHLCPGGIDVGSGTRAGWLPWEAFTQAMETKSSFLLFLSPQEHYMLPKRCFRDDAEVAAARVLLRQELGVKFRGL